MRLPFLDRWFGRRPQVRLGLDPTWLRQARVKMPESRPQRPPEEVPPPRTPAAPPTVPRSGRWRLLALGLAVVEVVLLVLAVTSSAFRVREVDVVGAQRTSAAEVIRTAGLERPGSVFLVDGAAIRQRLTSDVWVRSSAVSTSLPGRVEITVEEWPAVAVYKGGNGPDVVVNERGVVLGLAGPEAATLPRIDGPGSVTKPGRQALDGTLLVALVNIQRSLPGLIGQRVLQFDLDRCHRLTLVGVGGWRVLFGRMQAPADYDSLRPKLEALQAVAPHVDFGDPATYVNVMNPQQPAVGRGQDAAPTPPPTPPASGARATTPARTPAPAQAAC